VTTTLNGSPVTPTVTKNGGTTTAIYHGFPTLLPPGSTNIVAVHGQDTNSNFITGTRTFVVPNYGTINASLAVAGVNTTAPGFRIKPWQSGAEPNHNYWSMEQVEGLHGTNNADLTLATDGGYIDYTTNVINFNINPASLGGGDGGDFQTNNGYSDSLFPGIPGLNGLNGSTAEDILGFIRFPTAGLYTMGVNSDDGFIVTMGANPKDRFATVLGQFDGGRGPTDTLMTFAVTNAGIYPIRLLWENGNGELPGNGAGLEWFTVTTNGTKILVNDPSVTNTTGVTVFYSGPALPAYVSQINPYMGAANTRADTLVAQLTDGSTTVNGGSISLKVNGAPVTTTITKVGNVTTVKGADAAHLLTPGTNTARLVWSDSGPTTTTNTWSFTVAAYATLNASISAPLSAADLSKPGFVLRVAQVDPCLPTVINTNTPSDCGDGTVNQVDSANAMVAGLYYPWYGTNSADPNTLPADVISGNSFIWYWSNSVDFNIITSPGDFTFDYKMPGIPTVDNVASRPNDSFSASFDSYVAFPTPGYYVLGVSSDDGFRLSQGWGVSREILHVKGASVERDVAAVPSTPITAGGAIWQAALPTVPITAPITYVDNSQCPGPTTMDLTGQIALIDANRCGADGADGGYNNLVAMCQARGAIAVIVQASPGWGTPEVMGGGTTPITIPALHINGYNGEKEWFHTNGPLVATIGGDTHLKLGEADFGKGMDHRDFGFVVPAAGLYPLHLIYEQGGGGAGLEWSIVAPDIAFDSANRVLVNDNTSSGTLLAYRAITTPPKFTSLTTLNGTLTMTWFGGGVLQQTSSLNPSSWTDVDPQPPGDSYVVSTTGAKFYRLRR
jgi:hypothetical protein